MVTMSREPLVGAIINVHSEDRLLIFVCEEATEISVHDHSTFILLLVRRLETTITQD